MYFLPFQGLVAMQNMPFYTPKGALSHCERTPLRKQKGIIQNPFKSLFYKRPSPYEGL